MSGQQAHEKMLKIISPQGTADKNHNETPLHTQLTAILEKNKQTKRKIARIGEDVQNKTPHTCWWDVKWYSHVGKQSGGSSKDHSELPNDPRYCPREIKTLWPHKNLIQMFIEVLFIIACKWKQPKCPSTAAWVSKHCTSMQWNNIQP